MPRFALPQTSFRGAKTGRTTDCITNHWTRGETATLLSRRVLHSKLRGGGFARVSSVVRCFSVFTKARSMKTLFQLSTFFILLTIGSSFAYACSCADPSQRERFRKSKAVFLGEVLEYKERPGVETNEDLKFFPYQVTFKVQKQWKGKRQPEITAFASFDSPGMCGDLDLQMGERFLIYAPYKYEHLLIYRDCGPNRIAENAEDEIKRLSNFFFRTTTFFYPYPKF